MEAPVLYEASERRKRDEWKGRRGVQTAYMAEEDIVGGCEREREESAKRAPRRSRGAV